MYIYDGRLLDTEVVLALKSNICSKARLYKGSFHGSAEHFSYLYLFGYNKHLPLNN